MLPIENPCGVIRPFDEGPQTQESKGIASHQSAVGGTPKQMRTVFDPLEKRGFTVGLQPHVAYLLQLQPGAVDAFPHLGSNLAAYRMGACTGQPETRVDTGRAIRIQRKEVQYVADAHLAVTGTVVIQGPGDCQRRYHVVFS